MANSEDFPQVINTDEIVPRVADEAEDVGPSTKQFLSLPNIQVSKRSHDEDQTEEGSKSNDVWLWLLLI